MIETPFDFVKSILYKKELTNLAEENFKKFDLYIINRALSFYPGVSELLSHLESYLYQIPKPIAYKVLYEVIPEQHSFHKYKSAKKVSKEKDKGLIIQKISEHYLLTQKDAKIFLERLDKNSDEYKYFSSFS